MKARAIPVQVWPQALGLRLSVGRAALWDRLDGEVAPLAHPVSACFVVGCGNSGTTLVASRLGLHSRAYTIPRETGIFRPKRRLGEARALLAGWMDKSAQAGATHLIEKTPRHVHVVGRIRRLVPEARVIVVLRNPFDTVLSMKGRPRWSFDAALARWIIDNRAALELVGNAATTHVRYEHLTAAPRDELGRLVAFLGLDWEDRILEATESAYTRHAHQGPTMKLRAQQVVQPVRSNSGKWRSGLTRREVERIRHQAGDLWQRLGGDAATGEWR